MPIAARVSAVVGWLAFSAAAFAQQPKLDEVLRSINQSTRGEGSAIDFKPFLLVAVAASLLLISVKHWNRRQTAPKALNNHVKLLKEASAAAGLPHRKLRSLESLARGQGMSSPLVAILCPSAITELAKNVKTDAERQAVIGLAQEVLKP